MTEPVMSNIPHPATELILPNASQSPARYVLLDPVEDQHSLRSNTGISEVYELLSLRKWTFIGTIALAILIGAAYTFLKRPEFRASATIEIETPSEFLSLPGAPPESQEDNFMQTQRHLLESKSLRDRVDRVLVSKPQEWTARPNQVELLARRLNLTRTAPAPQASLPETGITIRNFDRTRLVEIECESTSPQLAADCANTSAHQFDQMQTEARIESARHAGAWLTSQIEEVRETLRKAESELESFSRNAGQLYGTDQQSAEQTKLMQLETELSRASADRIQKQSSYEIARRTPAETVPQVVDDGKLSSYALKLADLKRQLAEARTQMTPQHPKVQELTAQIGELEGTVAKERSDILTRVQNDYSTSLMREQLLQTAYNKAQQAVKQQAGQSVYYDLLRREVDSDRKLYDELLEKSRTAGLASAMTGSIVHVIDPAGTPTAPFEPKPAEDLGVAAASGLVLGFGLVIVSAQVNRSLRSPGESPQHLGVPELGVIPVYGSDYTRAVRRRLESPKTIPLELEKQAPLIPVWKDGSSEIAESFRSTVASILASPGGMRQRVIMINSLARGDGKSMTAASLGVALAEFNQRVLLIDADMRKPHLHRLFGLSNAWGLTNLLREKTSLKEVPLEALAQRTDVPGLFVLPAGPGTATIASLLYSQRLNSLIDRVRKEFDVVLLDTPPVSCMSDARVLGRVADSAVLVIRAGRTTRDEALTAKERLTADGIRVLGTILNGWKPRSKSRYGYYNYSKSEIANWA